MLQKNSGFTLIEILVVATIMIVLTAIGVASFSVANQSARDAKRKSDVETLRQGMVLYKSQNGRYATTQAELLAGYVTPPFPQDPAGTNYAIAYDGAPAPLGETFCICATLQQTTKGNSNSSTCAGSWANTGYQFYCARHP